MNSDRWVRWAAIVSVVVVGLVAGIGSYFHVLGLGERSGEAWRAAILPLSVDGMLVASTLAIVARRMRGQHAGVTPWLGLVAGIAASLAANVAAAEPNLTARIVAARPPIALAISIEVLVVVLRTASTPAAPAEGANVASVPASAVPAVPTAPTDRDPETTASSATPAPRQRRKSRKRQPVTPAETAELAGRIRQLQADRDEPLGRPTLARELGTTEHQIRRAMAVPVTSTNGHGPG